MTKMLDTTETATDSMTGAPIDHFTAVLDEAWAEPELALAGRPLDELGGLRRGQPIVSAAGYEIGVLDGVVIDDELATHLVLQPGHRFGSRDLILPIARVRFDADPLRVVLSRAAIDDLPPVSIERAVPPTPLTVDDDRERRRRVVRLCASGPHRRTSIPRRALVAEPVRRTLVAV